MIIFLIFFREEYDNDIDLEGAVAQQQAFEPRVTQPLEKSRTPVVVDQATTTHVTSTILRSNFILLDGQVSSFTEIVLCWSLHSL